MTENQTNENAGETLCCEDLLEIIYEESKALRTEITERIFQNSEKMWKMLEILILLLGVYTTVYLYILNEYKKQVVSNPSIVFPTAISLPAVFCICFFLVSFFYALDGIQPKPSFFATIPDDLYKVMINHRIEKNFTLKELTLSNLQQYKKSVSILEKINCRRRRVIYPLYFSLFEFILSLLAFVVNELESTIKIISLASLCTFVPIYRALVIEEKKRIAFTEKQMNSKQNLRSNENV